MTHFKDIKLDDLRIGNVQSGRTPTAPITWGEAVLRASLATHDEPATVAWHPRGFEGDERPRADLLLLVSPECIEWVRTIEAAALALLQKDPERYLPGSTADGLALVFRSAVKETKQGLAVRAKVTVNGNRPVYCWGPGRERITLPTDLGGAHVLPLVRAAHVWLSPTSVGVMWDVSDLMILSTRPPHECPWDI
jgi:hypothetical protein